jgi:hypothetical protein
MDSRQTAHFVGGAMMEYYRFNKWKPEDYTQYTQESINKVWKYLTQPSQTIDASYTDIQAHIALEAGKIHFPQSLKRR